jgi:myo-inositol 2-dehydrogenase/D-chiro-inositol 1-dehydrogenase
MLNRRRFLNRMAAASAAAIGVPHIVPGSALGADGAVAPSNRIHVAMIGLGRQTMAFNLPFFVNEPDAQVVAVCDVDAWRLELASDRLERTCRDKEALNELRRKGSRSNDYREVIARSDVDAVMVATTDHSHVPISIAAVQAGKDVCCEKPIARTIEEGRRLADAVAKHKRVFRTDSEFRAIPHLHRAVELVRNGFIGQIKSIQTSVPVGKQSSPPNTAMPVPEDLDYDLWQQGARKHPYTEARVHPNKGWGRPGWMSILDYCNGMITNWGAHLNDIAQWGNDSEHTGPVEISGKGKYLQGELWNTLNSFEVSYRFADGVEMSYRTGGAYVRFEGTEGWIKSLWRGNPALTASRESLLTAELGPDSLRFPLIHEKRDFLNAVKSRSTPMNDAEVGHRTNSMNLLGHIAIHVGRPLRWDPKTERVLGDEEANRYVAQPIVEPPPPT